MMTDRDQPGLAACAGRWATELAADRRAFPRGDYPLTPAGARQRAVDMYVDEMVIHHGINPQVARREAEEFL